MTDHCRHLRLAGYLGVLALIGGPCPVHAQVDLTGKVVLANVDRYPVSYRVGSLEKKIEPGKASVLTPKQLPLEFEIWNGVPGIAGWERQSVSAAGVYNVRFKLGKWTLTRFTPRATAVTAPGAAPFRPSALRTTGFVPRVMTRPSFNAYNNRVPFLRRVAWNVLGVFRVVQDEQDRELFRQVLMGDEIDLETKQELVDRFDQLASELPYYQRRDFQRAFNDLNQLTAQELDTLQAATDDDWNQVRDALGNQVTAEDWQILEADFLNATDDLAAAQAVANAEAGGGNIDVAELEAANLNGMLENIDIADLGDGFEALNLGTYRGYVYWGFDDFGGYDKWNGGWADGGWADGGWGGGGWGGWGYGGWGYDMGGWGAGGWGGGYEDVGGYDDFGGGFGDFN